MKIKEMKMGKNEKPKNEKLLYCDIFPFFNKYITENEENE